MDLDKVMLTGNDPHAFIVSWNTMIVTMPPETRKRLTPIFSACLRKYGFPEFVQQLTNKSVAVILAEFGHLSEPTPLESGELDGLKWKLYGPSEGISD